MNERAKITASHLAPCRRLSAPVKRRASRAQSRIDGAEIRLPARPASSVGPPNGSSSLMKIWACLTRSGFARLTAEVALARVGLVLGTLGCVCDGVRSRALGTRKPGRSQGPAQAWSMARVVEGNGCFASNSARLYTIGAAAGGEMRDGRAFGHA